MKLNKMFFYLRNTDYIVFVEIAFYLSINKTDTTPVYIMYLFFVNDTFPLLDKHYHT